MPFFPNSSAINRAEYDPGSRRMQIWFVESGGPYSFCGVPTVVFEGLCRAPSKGGFYNDYIRDRYPC